MVLLLALTVSACAARFRQLSKAIQNTYVRHELFSGWTRSGRRLRRSLDEAGRAGESRAI